MRNTERKPQGASTQVGRKRAFPSAKGFAARGYRHAKQRPKAIGLGRNERFLPPMVSPLEGIGMRNNARKAALRSRGSQAMCHPTTVAPWPPFCHLCRKRAPLLCLRLPPRCETVNRLSSFFILIFIRCHCCVNVIFIKIGKGSLFIILYFILFFPVAWNVNRCDAWG